MACYVLANFGGPRSLEEVEPFLEELLCDRDVVQTAWPDFIHRLLFRRVARKRALKVRHDYGRIGGKSPIYWDTEEMAKKISNILSSPVVPFHRYLPETHAEFLEKIRSLNEKEVRVISCFPQFTYATSGSIARFLARHLPQIDFRWICSYPDHPAFLNAFVQRIAQFLVQYCIEEGEAILLFSAHGLPQAFVDAGDPYEAQCQKSYELLKRAFPRAVSLLSYQSKFGRGEWLRPYTDEMCESVLSWNAGRKKIVMVPLSFISDHVETLFEIEEMYLPILRKWGMQAFRCPALSLQPYWIEALAQIAKEVTLTPNDALIRR